MEINKVQIISADLILVIAMEIKHSSIRLTVSVQCRVKLLDCGSLYLLVRLINAGLCRCVYVAAKKTGIKKMSVGRCSNRCCKYSQKNMSWVKKWIRYRKSCFQHCKEGLGKKPECRDKEKQDYNSACSKCFQSRHDQDCHTWGWYVCLGLASLAQCIKMISNMEWMRSLATLWPFPNFCRSCTVIIMSQISNLCWLPLAR